MAGLAKDKTTPKLSNRQSSGNIGAFTGTIQLVQRQFNAKRSGNKNHFHFFPPRFRVFSLKRGVHVFLNGAFVPEEKAVISIFDRGFLYGDGLFEAIRIYNGAPFQIGRAHV